MRTPPPDSRSLVRHLNEQRVLDAVFREGPVSRVELAELNRLSKPTISALVSRLLQADLVRESGLRSGSLGRNARLYEVNRHAGHVVAVDLGGTKVRVAIADLFGEILHEDKEPTESRGGEAVVAQIARMSRSLADAAGRPWNLVRAVAVGSPGVVNPETGFVDLAFNIPGFDQIPLADRLSGQLATAVVVDNDVNLAAIGERWRGLAADCENFAFLSVGTGVGLGLVVNGELCQGFRGAGGEIAYLPIGTDPFDPANQRRGPLEEAASASGIRRRLAQAVGSERTSGLTGESSVQDVFEHAASGDALALELVEQEARILALAIASISSIADPRLIVLGGGIGSNELLLEPVRSWTRKLLPHPLDIEASGLGDRAALIGAVAVGLREVRSTLIVRSEGGV